eukprot:scaffold241297_cov22-Tisochrysis_lutea.AAC.1
MHTPGPGLCNLLASLPSHQRMNSEEPAPVQHQHFPPPTAVPAPAPAATGHKRAGGKGRRATSKDQDACVRVHKKSQAMSLCE